MLSLLKSSLLPSILGCICHTPYQYLRSLKLAHFLFNILFLHNSLHDPFIHIAKVKASKGGHCIFYLFESARIEYRRINHTWQSEGEDSKRESGWRQSINRMTSLSQLFLALSLLLEFLILLLCLFFSPSNFFFIL